MSGQRSGVTMVVSYQRSRPLVDGNKCRQGGSRQNGSVTRTLGVWPEGWAWGS
ncbi:unnamed protein product [Brassica napus]|nr:unnamed protein product [Brassica napus]